MFFNRKKDPYVDEVKAAMDKDYSDFYEPPAKQESFLDRFRRKEPDTRQDAPEAERSYPQPERSHVPISPARPSDEWRFEEQARAEKPNLFVKVDKYREVFTTLQEMKLFVTSIKDLFAVLQQLEAVRSDALDTMRSSVQRIERSMAQIDTDLMRPRNVQNRDMGVAETERRHMEETLSSLHRQLEELKSDLHSMRPA